MSDDVFIVGAGIHSFGRTPGLSGLQQGVVAVRQALDRAGLAWPDIQFAFGGSDAAGNADTMVSELGLTGIPFINVANGCATGGSAMFGAYSTIKSGEFDLGLAVGFDKHPRGSFSPLPADWGLPDWYGETGLMLTTQFFAMKIQRYMSIYGITPHTLGAVAEKAFANGVLADHAWRREAVDIDTIMNSQMVSDPLTKFMFCSPGEGAVALLLASGKKARELGLPAVRLRAAAVRTRPRAPSRFSRQRLILNAVVRRPASPRERPTIWPASAPRISTSRSFRIRRWARRSCTWPRMAFALMATRPSGSREVARGSTETCRSTPTADVLPVGSRSAHPDFARCTKIICS